MSTHPAESPFARSAALVLCACLGIAAALSASGCRNRGVAASASADAPPAQEPEKRGWFRKRPPPPRHEQLDSARYTGVATHANTGGAEAQAVLPTGQAGTNTPPSPEPAGVWVADVEKWQPAWWAAAPTIEGDTLHVYAQGEDLELLAARKLAIEQARKQLKAQLAGVKPPESPATLVDSVRLSDGRYRAFVRLSAPAPAR